MAKYGGPMNVIICCPWFFHCLLEKVESCLDLLFQPLDGDHSLVLLVHLTDGDERFRVSPDLVNPIASKPNDGSSHGLRNAHLLPLSRFIVVNISKSFSNAFIASFEFDCLLEQILRYLDLLGSPLKSDHPILVLRLLPNYDRGSRVSPDQSDPLATWPNDCSTEGLCKRHLHFFWCIVWCPDEFSSKAATATWWSNVID